MRYSAQNVNKKYSSMIWTDLKNLNGIYFESVCTGLTEKNIYTKPYHIKNLLQFLICIVDTKLFKAVNFKSFKPDNK